MINFSYFIQMHLWLTPVILMIYNKLYNSVGVSFKIGIDQQAKTILSFSHEIK